MSRTRWTTLVALLLAAACTAGSGDAATHRPEDLGSNVSVVAAEQAPAPPPAPEPPPAPPKTIVATAVVSTVDVYPDPAADGSPIASFSHPTQMAVPLVFRVTLVQEPWLQVMLPMRPNGVTGWIQSSDVNLSESEYRAQVELGNHMLTVWRGNDIVEQTTVAVGKSSAPTPTGDFYLTELIDTENPGGSYGPYAFGLSAYSDVYTEFAGGPGQIGMHGTNAPGLLGGDVSHGCIRVDNEIITKLAFELPVGSPITVTA